jgi:hypothetical protein
MATVIEEYTTENQRSPVRFLWAKGPIVKDVYKEMLSVYGAKCLSRSQLGDRCFDEDEEAETEVRM